MRPCWLENLPIIITDLDGTLVNIADEVLATIWGQQRVALTLEDWTQYDPTNAYWPQLAHLPAFSTQEKTEKYFCNTCWNNPALMRQAKPYWYVWHTLRMYVNLMQEYNHAPDLYALTARTPTQPIQDVTRAWLHYWDLDQTYVVFSELESEADKGAWLAERILDEKTTWRKRVIWILEDSPKNAQKLQSAAYATHREETVKIILLDRPWTKTLQTTYPIRIEDLRATLKTLLP